MVDHVSIPKRRCHANQGSKDLLNTCKASPRVHNPMLPIHHPRYDLCLPIHSFPMTFDLVPSKVIIINHGKVVWVCVCNIISNPLEVESENDIKSSFINTSIILKALGSLCQNCRADFVQYRVENFCLRPVIHSVANLTATTA